MGDAIWSKFQELLAQSLFIVEALSQGWFLANFFKQQENGWFLAVVCVGPQIFRVLLHTDEFGGGESI